MLVMVSVKNIVLKGLGSTWRWKREDCKGNRDRQHG